MCHGAKTFDFYCKSRECWVGTNNLFFCFGSDVPTPFRNPQDMYLTCREHFPITLYTIVCGQEFRIIAGQPLSKRCSTQQTYLHSIVCGQEFRIIAGQPPSKRCSTQQTYLHSIVCGQEFRIIVGQPLSKRCSTQQSYLHSIVCGKAYGIIA